MREISEFTFWVLCTMAAIGFLQALASVLMKEPKKDWKVPTHSPPGEAPEGFEWVLVRKDQIDR